MESTIKRGKGNGDSLNRDLSNQTFERWTVLGDCIRTAKNERKWLCRCKCGTERYVLERSLRYGSSVSCGCLRKEKASKALTIDLKDRTFGELTVIRQVENTGKNAGAMWLCHCSCGEEYKVLGTLLINGRRTRCSSRIHKKNYAYKDITGRKVNNLKVLYRKEDSIGNKKGVVWHCLCDCGNEVDVSYKDLIHSPRKSCGCVRKENLQKLKDSLTHVDGTSLDMIKSKKVPVNNTTGYKGVYLSRGKYAAKIVFQQKAYYLGSFDTAKKAVEARQKAEDILYGGVIAFYEKWQARAEEDPEWAKKNPVKFRVKRNGDSGISVNYFPAGLQ